MIDPVSDRMARSESEETGGCVGISGLNSLQNCESRGSRPRWCSRNRTICSSSRIDQERSGAFGCCSVASLSTRDCTRGAPGAKCALRDSFS